MKEKKELLQERSKRDRQTRNSRRVEEEDPKETHTWALVLRRLRRASQITTDSADGDRQFKKEVYVVQLVVFVEQEISERRGEEEENATIAPIASHGLLLLLR